MTRLARQLRSERDMETAGCATAAARAGRSSQPRPGELPQGPDRDRARRATGSMLRMTKLDIAGLEEAAQAGSPPRGPGDGHADRSL